MKILERPVPGHPIRLLPHLITLANAGCGLLAISKSIEALALSRENPDVFFLKMGTACWLVLLAMVFDALDGFVARLTNSASEYGGQLDSFSDFLTFGCAPALLVKVLVEHQGVEVGYNGFPRLHFVCAASFALLALLRLVRFNIENTSDEESHQGFSGLPSPAAAGAVVATILLYLALRRPDLEVVDEGTQTPVGGAFGLLRDRWPEVHASLPGWMLPALLLMLVGLGLLMVSRVPYTHVVSRLTRRRPFTTLVWVVLAAALLFSAPVWFLFLGFNGYVFYGLLGVVLRRRDHEDAIDRAA